MTFQDRDGISAVFLLTKEEWDAVPEVFDLWPHFCEYNRGLSFNSLAHAMDYIQRNNITVTETIEAGWAY